MRQILFLLLFLLSFSCLLLGQGEFNGKIEQREMIKDCGIKLSKYPILISSLKITNQNKEITSMFRIENGWLLLDSLGCNLLKNDTLNISYRIFPIDFNKKYSLIDSSQLKKKETVIAIEYDMNPFDQNKKPIINKGIDYSGSFSRGFSVGNSQSLVLNSNLNLQLQGDLGNGLKVVAAISDDNIPIQPEGNTQVLQEFDKVFIEVSKDKTSVIAGDYELQRPKSYFMNYYKKLKGLGVHHDSKLTKKYELSTSANIASSRGKFSRQNLETTEGNQGPYRLKGNNNERYIIILSGTEKIYSDGRLLRRGLEFDYIIDYNTAEITFSPTVLIKKESRIIIEFEYSDQNYFRTLYAVNTNLSSEKIGFGFNYYSEQDSKNSTSQLELSPEDIAILESIGDSNAFRSGIYAYDTSSTQPGYKYVDNPNFPTDPNVKYLIYTSNKNEVEVSAAFTEVGSAKGSYVIDASAAVNARIYKFVGYKLGNYDPIVTLIPPEQKQMMAFNTYYEVNKNFGLNGELSLSNTDKNRFSAINDNDNIGLAGIVAYHYNKNLSKDSTLVFHNLLSLEITDEKFKPLNPYRNAEFLRDWNLSNNFLANEKERILTAKIGLSKKAGNRINYSFSNYNVKNIINGNKHNIDFNIENHGFHISSNSSYSTIEGSITKSNFFRPYLELSKSFYLFQSNIIGISYEGENNIIKSVNSDSLLTNSYAYDYLKAFFKTDSISKINYQFSINKRKDRKADGMQLQNALDINEAEFQSSWSNESSQSLLVNLKYRNFKVLNEVLVPNEKSKNTILGSIDHQWTLFKKSLNLGTNYLINSGQEPKLEYVYTKVENNQGDYVYIGSDTTSIKSNNDFRYDPTNPTATYIRVTLPNNEFIRTNNISLNESIKFEPKTIWAQDTLPLTKIKKFIGKFGTSATLRLTNKAMDVGSGNPNFLNFSTADSSLVSYNNLQNYNVYFNRGNPSYDINFFNRSNKSKINLINGIEERTLNEDELRTRWNFATRTDFIISGTKGNKSYDNRIYTARNLSLDYYKINPEIEFRPSTKSRYSLKYSYEKRTQQILNLEQAIIQYFTGSINFRKESSSAIDLTVSFVKINFDYTNSDIEYDMLDGLKAGSNYLWNASYTKRFSGNIDFNINYEGRKTGDAPTVHVMRAQVKASF